MMVAGVTQSKEDLYALRNHFEMTSRNKTVSEKKPHWLIPTLIKSLLIVNLFS